MLILKQFFMRIFWKYIFPAVFGLLIYTSIRLVTDTTTREKFWTRPWQVNAIEVIIVVLMSYVFEMFLKRYISKFNKRKVEFRTKNILKEFAEIFLTCFAFLNPILFLIHYLINNPVKWSDFAIANIVVLLYILLYYAIARGNALIKAFVEQQLQLEKVKNDQLDAELKFLKAQYHPHFLFNALNTIYFQMDESVDDAKKTVEKFSELLRYQIYDQQQTVPVSQEIQYLQHFIDLQKVRTSERLQLEVAFDNSLNGEQVYPLLFLPLVENAFKYAGGEYKMKIACTKKDDEIIFFVENSVPGDISFTKSGGIGLDNLKRRLALLYPQKHDFTTRRKNNSFTAELKIKLS